MNIAWLLNHAGQSFGGQPAIVADGTTTTFAELAARAEGYSAAVSSAGLRRGDRGGIAVIINELYRPRQIEYLLAHSGAGFLIAGPELMAVDESLAVEMRPESGLVVHAESETLSNVDEVTFTRQAVIVRTPNEEAAFDFERARPLGWLMPGVAAWRVRQIPEVIAWARSFAAFDECLPQAAALGAELRLTTKYPFFGPSSANLTT